MWAQLVNKIVNKLVDSLIIGDQYNNVDLITRDENGDKITGVNNTNNNVNTSTYNDNIIPGLGDIKQDPDSDDKDEEDYSPGSLFDNNDDDDKTYTDMDELVEYDSDDDIDDDNNDKMPGVQPQLYSDSDSDSDSDDKSI